MILSFLFHLPRVSAEAINVYGVTLDVESVRRLDDNSAVFVVHGVSRVVPEQELSQAILRAHLLERSFTNESLVQIVDGATKAHDKGILQTLVCGCIASPARTTQSYDKVFQQIAAGGDGLDLLKEIFEHRCQNDPAADLSLVGWAIAVHDPECQHADVVHLHLQLADRIHC